MSTTEKTVRNILNYVRDNVSSNLVKGSRMNMFKVDQAELSKIINLVNASIDEAFIKSSSELDKLDSPAPFKAIKKKFL